MSRVSYGKATMKSDPEVGDVPCVGLGLATFNQYLAQNIFLHASLAICSFNVGAQLL